jgi:hypothetical protein
LKWAVKGAPIARRKTGVFRRPMRAPPAAVETLDSPFQSEKVSSKRLTANGGGWGTRRT